MKLFILTLVIVVLGIYTNNMVRVLHSHNERVKTAIEQLYE